MFEGLTSRCTRSLACAASSAEAAWPTISTAVVSGSAPARLQHRPEIAALDQAHVEEQPAVDLAEVVDGDDVRLVQAGRQARLAPEAGLERLVAGEVVGQHLQRDLALTDGVVGAVDLAHAAAADQLDEAIAAELLRHRTSLDRPPSRRRAATVTRHGAGTGMIARASGPPLVRPCRVLCTGFGPLAGGGRYVRLRGEGRAASCDGSETKDPHVLSDPLSHPQDLDIVSHPQRREQPQRRNGGTTACRSHSRIRPCRAT